MTGELREERNINIQLETRNAKRQTPNAKRQTPNAKLQTECGKKERPRWWRGLGVRIGWKWEEGLMSADEINNEENGEGNSEQP